MGKGPKRERGSVLIIAVIAMLVMGVLSVSFALLASLETKIGVNYTHQLQARGLADAAFAYGKDQVSGAASGGGGFSNWFNGTSATHILAGSSATNGRDLAPGEYWARIDNDCNTIPDDAAAASQLVPTGIQDSNCGTGTANTTDNNRTAVLTAWAQAGSGQTIARARIRAIVGIDDPWKHVCATATANSTCTDPINQAGNPTINPSDTGHPNGPKTYPDLPKPTLGCSQIDPSLHGNAGCAAEGRKVMVGVAGDPRNCNDPINGIAYSGYFDCALTTPCDTAVDFCPGGANIPACVLLGDGRIGPLYVVRDPSGVCPNGATGMVFNYLAFGIRTTSQDIDAVFQGQVGCSVAVNPCPGGNQVGRTIYVMRGSSQGQVEVRHAGGPDVTVYGTIALEGDGPPEDCPGAGSDFQAKSQTAVRTRATAYGYPLVLLLYDPQQAPPNATTRQQICADLGAGGGNTQVEGIVYSAGKVEFNPLTLNGGVVAYDVETQGSAVYTYNTVFGNAAPPPGFALDDGANVAILRKSYISCTSISGNASGHDYDNPSRCN